MTFRTPYPDYDVLAKWRGPSFNEQTRRVLAARLGPPPARRFFTVDQWVLLEAVATRLIPQPEREAPVPITPWIDDALSENRGEGFRFADMPDMRQAWRAGLAGIAGEALRHHGSAFPALAADLQDALLKRIQRGDIHPPLWAVPSQRFFADVLLKTVVGIYYAHPAAWSEIGFGGPASPRGYVRMDPDRRDPWEAAEVRDG